jgi:D-alanyl-D-alanine carboxypeptidase (penicillin-binding protein 5/6)
MLEASLKNDTFKKIFTTTHYTIAETNLHNERTISAYNNYLINKDNVSAYYDARVKGSRMAVDNYGYRNIASYAESGNMQVICIVTGTKSTLADNGTTQVFGGFLETTALLNKCFEKYNTYQFTYSDQVLQQKTVINGDSDVYLTSGKSLSAVLPRGTSLDDLTFRYSDLEDSNNAPVKKGDILGSLSVWYGSSCVGYTELTAMNDVPLAYTKVILPEKQEQSFPWWGIALIAIGCFLFLSVCLMIILRVRSTVRHKKAAKRYRREKTDAPMG